MGRAIFKAELGGLIEPLGLNDPTAAALASLLAAPNSKEMLKQFLAAGGISVVVQLLRNSKCEQTLKHTANLITEFFSNRRHHKRPLHSRDLVDELQNAGGCSR